MDNKTENNYTKIGKDVIESLTQGMYEDCRFIYREYIQNSADQIDKAVEEGLLKDQSKGIIYIDIYKTEKKITIIDNATGIESKNVLTILRNIAKSPKDRSKDKGFRGIGRLGGLAYCDSLIFETSFKGEKIKSIMTWDALKLREIINNRQLHEDATDVIDSITSIKTEVEDPEEVYFRVILLNVTNDILLDKENIRKYLSMVAPVPYNPISFRFADHIYKYVIENNHRLDEYNIFVNDDQIKKAYTNYLYEGSELNKTKYDEIIDIEFFEIKNDEEFYAWGWFGISSFNGFIPSLNISRGIRLRKGNIQIGLEDCLENFHKEKRGNSYFIGEIHAVNQYLIPNSRRDFFVENKSQSNFNSILRNLFTDKLYKYYHLASDIRSQLKSIKKTLEIKKDYEEKEKKGYKNKEEKSKLQDKFEENKERAIKAKDKLIKLSSAFINNGAEKRILKSVVKKETDFMQDLFGEKNKEINKVIEAIPLLIHKPPINDSNKSNNIKTNGVLPLEEISLNGSDSKKPILLVDTFKKLNKEQKKLLSKVFVIIEKILPKSEAELVIKKISEELR